MCFFCNMLSFVFLSLKLFMYRSMLHKIKLVYRGFLKYVRCAFLALAVWPSASKNKNKNNVAHSHGFWFIPKDAPSWSLMVGLGVG